MAKKDSNCRTCLSDCSFAPDRNPHPTLATTVASRPTVTPMSARPTPGRETRSNSRKASLD